MQRFKKGEKKYLVKCIYSQEAVSMFPNSGDGVMNDSSASGPDRRAQIASLFMVMKC